MEINVIHHINRTMETHTQSSQLLQKKKKNKKTFDKIQHTFMIENT